MFMELIYSRASSNATETQSGVQDEGIVCVINLFETQSGVQDYGLAQLVRVPTIELQTCREVDLNPT